jgi:quercetin dioxygenase-like cupin family protein
MKRETARRAETTPVENPPGILRTTIAYNDALMLCHFSLKKGVKVPFHNHPAAQNGYLISGRLRMLWEDGREFVAEPGSGWCFDSNVRHGAEALEDCEAVECFAPARTEYMPPEAAR